MRSLTLSSVLGLTLLLLGIMPSETKANRGRPVVGPAVRVMAPSLIRPHWWWHHHRPLMMTYSPRMSYSSAYPMMSAGYGSYPMSYMGSNPYQTAPGGANYGSTVPYMTGEANPIVSVATYDNAFQPTSVTIAVGMTVRWTNFGLHHHSIVSDDDQWGSTQLNPGEGFSYTFNRPGIFAYHCGMHPRSMRGVIIVERDADSSAQRTPIASGPTEIEVSGPLNTPPPRRAIIRLRLPRTWVSVAIDGRKIDEMGKSRTYVTPELSGARTFEVTATWNANGHSNRMQEKVTVRAGQIRTLDFTSGD